MVVQAPRVLPELEGNLRALTEDEREHLEVSILAEGCREPLVVWEEENVILDGHNRFRICEKHGLPLPQVTYVSLPSLEAALMWQVRNQFGKRNLTPLEISYLRGRDYLASKQEHGGDRKKSEASGQNVHLKTGEVVASRHGTTERTVRRDAGYAEAVDVLAGVLGPDVRTRLLTGEGLDATPSKQDVLSLARTIKESPEVGKTAASLLTGEQPNDLNGLNPHEVRDPQLAVLLARIERENGELTYLQLFEQVETVNTPLIRHDRAQLEFILSLAKKEPDEETALVVSRVGARYKLTQSLAQLTYLARLADGGEVTAEEMAECVKKSYEKGRNIYWAVWDEFGCWPAAPPLQDEAGAA